MRSLWIFAVWLGLGALLRAEPGDVEGSHDYPGFPRLYGFTISDFDEDNPSSYDFPVARPLPEDASHIENFRVKGHRYVIRYELSPGNERASRTLIQTQQYYEKLAGIAGFTVQKTGAVGDVTETYYGNKNGRDIWVHLEPGMTVNVLTVVESYGSAQPLAPSRSAATGPEDSLYVDLTRNGRVILPMSFLPGKPDVSSDAQPMIDRVVRIMKRHDDLVLTIEGFTDDAGDALDNQRLSSARAHAVKTLIVAGGIDKKRLVTLGMGGTHPVADNATAEGREKNRRIELVIRGQTTP